MDTSHSMPVPMKKTLVLVNNFIADTVRFLNHFSVLAEEKIQKVDADITRVETALVLLESRLANIDGLEPLVTSSVPTAAAVRAGTGQLSATISQPLTAPATSASATAQAPAVSSSASSAAVAPPPAAAVPAAAPLPAPAPAPAAPEVPMPTVKDHPAYAKFFRFLSMQIPAEQLKVRMTVEGFRPELLDTPDAPITVIGDDISRMIIAERGASATPAAAPAPAPVAAPAPVPAVAAPIPAPAPAPAPTPTSAPGGGGALKDDPRYAPFFKMMRMGVPMGAAKLKAAAAGVDPEMLERDPDSPAP